MSEHRNLDEVLQSSFGNSRFSRKDQQSLKELSLEQNQNASFSKNLIEKAIGMVKEQLDASDHVHLNWLETVMKYSMAQPGATRARQSHAYFSPGTDCREQIIHQIKSAQSQIDICVFTITDNAITHEILRAFERGLQLRIISDNDKSIDRGSDIERLANAGIPLRVDESHKHMHHKFAIFDGEFLLSGSYNWTVSAANVNEENIIVTKEKILVKEFSEEFDKLWPQMTPYGDHH